MGSSDTNNELLSEFVIGARVKSLATKGPYHDLVLVFDNEAVVETFGDAGHFEQWRITAASTDLIVGGPGELWSSFIPEENL